MTTEFHLQKNLSLQIEIVSLIGLTVGIGLVVPQKSGTARMVIKIHAFGYSYGLFS